MKIIKSLFGKAIEVTLKALSIVGHCGQVAKDLKVTVRIQNQVETNDMLRHSAILAEKAWTDLFEDKKRAQLKGFPVNVAADLLITIKCVDGKTDVGQLSVSIESVYLTNVDPESDVAAALKEILEMANEAIDEVFSRDRSLLIDGNSFMNLSRTKQTLELNDFFEEKIEKLFLAVLVKKFVAQCNDK
ncbi:MAG: hypothetical protein WCO66_03750 [Candidatus Absconditabacteria bacterium]